MVDVEPFTLQKCTAFKERLQIVDKLNEIIHVLRNVPDDTETRLNEQDTKIDNFIEDTTQEITNFETTVNNEIDTFENAVNENIETFKTSVNEEITLFKTFVNNEIDTFESTINTEISTFESDVNASIATMQSDITTFRNSVNGEITRFEAYVNTEISNFESDVNDDIADMQSDITQFKTDINTAINTFETTINNEITSFKNTVNGQIATMQSDIADMQDDISLFKQSVNSAISTFESNVTNEITSFKSTVNTQITDMQNDIATFISGVSVDIANMQNDISTFETTVNNRVTSVESLVSTLNNLVNSGTYSNVNLSGPVNGVYTLTFIKRDNTTQSFNILIKDIKTITSSQSGNAITLTITYADNTSQTLTFNIDLSNFVTLTTNQEISGTKTFSNKIISNNYIQGNLLFPKIIRTQQRTTKNGQIIFSVPNSRGATGLIMVNANYGGVTHGLIHFHINNGANSNYYLNWISVAPIYTTSSWFTYNELVLIRGQSMTYLIDIHDDTGQSSSSFGRKYAMFILPGNSSSIDNFINTINYPENYLSPFVDIDTDARTITIDDTTESYTLYHVATM